MWKNAFKISVRDVRSLMWQDPWCHKQSFHRQTTLARKTRSITQKWKAEMCMSVIQGKGKACCSLWHRCSRRVSRWKCHQWFYHQNQCQRCWRQATLWSMLGKYNLYTGSFQKPFGVSMVSCYCLSLIRSVKPRPAVCLETYVSHGSTASCPLSWTLSVLHA